MKQYDLSEELHRQIAAQLYKSETELTPRPTLTAQYPQITLEDAYAIQKARFAAPKK